MINTQRGPSAQACLLVLSHYSLSFIHNIRSISNPTFQILPRNYSSSSGKSFSRRTTSHLSLYPSCSYLYDPQFFKMQFKAIVLSTVLGLVAAQSSDVASLVAELPSCSLTCLLAGASAADCESMDYACQCGKQDVIVANATSCLTSSCNTNDIASTFYSIQV